MASLNMNGPYNLGDNEIDKQITKTSSGNYALGYSKEDGTFIVCYVGRADSDINNRLKSWVGETSHSQFKYSYATSKKAAFEKECENYHDFGENNKLENEIHPDRSLNTAWKCPRCNIFD